MYYNYPLCIRFRGIMNKLQKYRFFTYIEVTNRKNCMTAERNTSVRRYIQNLGGVFARFFFSPLNSSENEANVLVFGGFLRHVFVAKIFDRKHTFCGEMKDKIKNLKDTPPR